MTRPNRHRAGLQAPYVLRPALVVFEGAPRSGRTTQFERLRLAQQAPTGGRPIFVGDPLFLTAGTSQAHGTASQELAVAALVTGRAVFADGWAVDAGLQPDLVLLSGTTLVGPTTEWPWPAVSPERVVPLPREHEGLVGAAIWTALVSRRVFATCECLLAVAS